MAVSGIGAYGVNAYGRGAYGIDGEEAARKAAESAAQKSTAKNKAAAAYPSTQTLQDLTAIVGAAMDSMGIAKNGNVTFGQITTYKEKLEKEYGDKLEKDLAALGVDKDIKFQLKLGKDGKMEVVSDHADRDKVQKYFDENPEMIKKYKGIQALADLESARKEMQVNPADLRKRIQVEAMATWWDQSGNSSSSIGDFSGGDMAFYKGINTTV